MKRGADRPTRPTTSGAERCPPRAASAAPTVTCRKERPTLPKRPACPNRPGPTNGPGHPEDAAGTAWEAPKPPTPVHQGQAAGRSARGTERRTHRTARRHGNGARGTTDSGHRAPAHQRTGPPPEVGCALLTVFARRAVARSAFARGVARWSAQDRRAHPTPRLPRTPPRAAGYVTPLPRARYTRKIRLFSFLVSCGVGVWLLVGPRSRLKSPGNPLRVGVNRDNNRHLSLGVGAVGSPGPPRGAPGRTRGG